LDFLCDNFIFLIFNLSYSLLDKNLGGKFSIAFAMRFAVSAQKALLRWKNRVSRNFRTYRKLQKTSWL